MAKFSAVVIPGTFAAAAATVCEDRFSSSNSNVREQRLAFGDEGMASQMGRVDGGLDHLDFNKEGWEQHGMRPGALALQPERKTLLRPQMQISPGCPRDFNLSHNDKARGSS